MNRVAHTFPPVFDKNSEILILGSFPSVKSRENLFFYGHQQNRFWKVIAAVCEAKVPATITDKKNLLLANRIALWDVIASCEVKGSSDSSITNVTPNDLSIIFQSAEIKKILLNGKTAEKFFKRFYFNKKAICLPSTSPANARWKLEGLIEIWREAIKK